MDKITPAITPVDDNDDANEDTGAIKKSNWYGIPEGVKDLLIDPPLFPGEVEDQFFRLFESFRRYADPQNVVEYHLVYAACVSKFETSRYRSMAAAIVANQRQAGLASLIFKADS